MAASAERPDLADVLAARARIAPYLTPTALHRYPALDAMAGAHLWVKHENHQPIGAFKVRGGVNLISQLTDDERRRGVITASTGNHGQSVAYAADLFGVRAVICVPEQANPVKVESMQALGAEIVFHGKDFDDAREHCEKLAAERGHRYIHSGNEPHLITGVATSTLEIPGRLPVLEGRRAGHRLDEHVRRGTGDQDRVRAAAAHHAGAPRRLSPGVRGRATACHPDDDRQDAQPGRAGRGGRACRGAEPPVPVRRPPGRDRLQRWQHQPGPARRAGGGARHDRYLAGSGRCADR
jgi:hypothetical protein